MAKSDELLPHIIEIKEKLARMEWIPDKVKELEVKQEGNEAFKNKALGVAFGVGAGGGVLGSYVGKLLTFFGGH